MREDWIEVELQEVFETVTGNTPSKQEIDNYGQDIPFIKPPDITNSAIKSISEYLSNKGKLKARVLPSNSVLITCIGNLGRVGFNKVEVAFNQQINAILPTDFIDFKFTFYQAQSGSFRNQLESLSTSTTVALVNKSSFNSVKIEVSPLPIQRAIVSKIEALFSDLDNGIANFKKAQEQLKIYRQSVLKKAFEGGFTNENVVAGELPNGWNLKMISDLCDMKAGYFIKADEINSEFEDGLFPCYGGNGLRGFVKSSTHEGIFPIVGRQGALCGNVHLINGKFHATEHAVVVTVKNEVDVKCLFYKLTEMKLNQYSTGTAQPGLSVNKILPIEIIYPSTFSEQTQIVQEIESRLSVCDKMEQSINESIEKAEALRQSILKKAFEGKLLSKAEIELCKKEADYEPASELLKKIQAEKLAKEQEKKKPTVKKKSKK